MTAETTARLVRILSVMPTGLLFRESVLEDTPETSLNFAVVATGEGQVTVTTMQRSSLESRKKAMVERLRALVELGGGSLESRVGTPPWEPDWNSPLYIRAARIWKDVTGEDAVAEVTHGALECGIIADKLAGTDALSFGPLIENPHSPDERLHIPSVGTAYHFLAALLKDLAG